MKFVEGALKRLGDSTVNVKNEYVKYSLIQLGEQIFTDVMIDRKLNNFLQDGLQTTDPTKLWLLNGNKVIMAVQVGNATRYYGKVNPFVYAAIAFYIAIAVDAGINFNIWWSVVIMAIAYFFFIRKIIDYRSIFSIGGNKV